MDLRSNNCITDSSLSLLTNITKINLGSNYTITDSSVSLLVNLNEINISNYTVITESGISLLTNLTRFIRGNTKGGSARKVLYRALFDM